MRKIAQKGVRAPQVNKAAKAAKASMAKKYRTGGMKKAQTGTQYTSSKPDQKAIEERQRYLDRIMNTNRPDTLTARSRYVPGLTERQERANIINERVRKVQENSPKQRGGGKTKKAQTGAKTSSPKNAMSMDELFPYGKTKTVRRSGDRMWKDKEVKISTPSRTITKSVRKKTVLGKLSNAKGRTGKKVY